MRSQGIDIEIDPTPPTRSCSHEHEEEVPSEDSSYNGCSEEDLEEELKTDDECPLTV